MTSSSTLNPDRTPGQDRITGKGHGTAALGPSDSSDSGSDVSGGPGLVEGQALGLDEGEPREAGSRGTAGPGIGDANLDSDSDRNGTGERGAAGRDEPENRDRLPDRIEGPSEDRGEDDELDLANTGDISTDDTLDANDGEERDEEAELDEDASGTQAKSSS